MLLGLDLGTTNVKAVLAHYDGKVVGRGSAPVGLLPVPPDGVEQDIDEVWAAAGKAIRQALERHDGGEVRAVGVSSQGGAMQLLDGEDRPYGRVVSWLDNRGGAENERLTKQKGTLWWIHHTGHARGGFAVGQLRRLWRQNRRSLAPPAKDRVRRRYHRRSPLQPGGP